MASLDCNLKKINTWRNRTAINNQIFITPLAFLSRCSKLLFTHSNQVQFFFEHFKVSAIVFHAYFSRECFRKWLEISLFPNIFTLCYFHTGSSPFLNFQLIPLFSNTKEKLENCICKSSTIQDFYTLPPENRLQFRFFFCYSWNFSISQIPRPQDSLSNAEVNNLNISWLYVSLVIIRIFFEKKVKKGLLRWKFVPVLFKPVEVPTSVLKKVF